MSIKVIGAGFGRTGTASLKAALEELGYNRCYHMQEVIANPKHAARWQAAAEGKTVDWDALLEGYQATVDWPGCTFYQALMDRYPDAKVLLNVRDPEAWYESMTNTVYKMTQLRFPQSLIPRVVPRIRGLSKMARVLIWQNTFNDRFADKAYALKVFNDHTEEVRRAVPAEKLLVYNVKEGWEPLCAFLEVPVPDKPFPRLNDSASFNRRLGPGMFRSKKPSPS